VTKMVRLSVKSLERGKGANSAPVLAQATAKSMERGMAAVMGWGLASGSELGSEVATVQLTERGLAPVSARGLVAGLAQVLEWESGACSE
jgi:hypothetical protein